MINFLLKCGIDTKTIKIDRKNNCVLWVFALEQYSIAFWANKLFFSCIKKKDLFEHKQMNYRPFQSLIKWNKWKYTKISQMLALWIVHFQACFSKNNPSSIIKDRVFHNLMPDLMYQLKIFFSIEALIRLID